jgi:hypothetical protein
MLNTIVFMILLLIAVPNCASAATVELPKTGQNLCYDATGAVIPCAGTGQDGQTQIGLPFPTPRFTDNLNGTITDNLTGLTWLKDSACSDIQPSGGSNWTTAIGAAGQLHSGQCQLSDGSLSGDWRLPNVNELESLIDLSQAYPSLPTGHPFINGGQIFWTTTTIALYPTNAENISTGNGCVRGDVKTVAHSVWPVKGISTKLAKTGQNTCWDINGNALACANTGQDGDKQAGASWPSPRFVDNGNGTIVDLLTHLVWLKNADCFGSQDTQDQALSAANTLANGACGLADGSAAGDWRLPNRKEMRGLANYQQTNGGTWLDSQGFSNGQNGYYWTSDSYPFGVDPGWLPAGADPNLGDKWMVNTKGGAWLSSWVSGLVPTESKYLLAVRGPFEAACGSANGQAFSSPPTTNLCSSGTPSVLTGTGPWNWTCSAPPAPSITASCSATLAAIAVPPTVVLTAPANGAALTAPATITMTAAATPGGGASVKRVDFYTGTTLLGSATSSPYSFTWSQVATGSYTLTAKVTDTLGATATSSPVSFTVTTTSVPTPWKSSDIGSVGAVGSAGFYNGVFSISGSGNDIGSTSDAFRFTYRPLKGNSQITARVVTQQNTDPSAKAGVMIRGTLAADSAQAMMIVTPGAGASFQRRLSAGKVSLTSAPYASTAPLWVRVVRKGTTFSGYVSLDGVTWTLVGTDTISMASTVYVGLAVTSHNSGVLCTSSFDNVTVQ